MNALNFWDVTDWREILQRIQRLEPFQVERKYSWIRFGLHGYSIPEDAKYRDIWKGSYLIHVDVQMMKGNYQGSCYATDDLKEFDTYERFIRLTDRSLKSFREEYSPLPAMIIPAEQLMLF